MTQLADAPPAPPPPRGPRGPGPAAPAPPHQRPAARRAAARPAPRRAGRDRHARGHGLPHRVRDLALAPPRRPALPRRDEWVGLDNYASVLSSDLWWQDLRTTLLITVISVAVELVIGMCLAVVMHRAIVGRGLVRSSILVPYGIVTVVAALAWKFAFTPGTGFVNTLARHRPGLAHRATAPPSSSSSAPRSGRRCRSWPCCCSRACRSSPTG